VSRGTRVPGSRVRVGRAGARTEVLDPARDPALTQAARNSGR
jgi:hypothetical protein